MIEADLRRERVAVGTADVAFVRDSHTLCSLSSRTTVSRAASISRRHDVMAYSSITAGRSTNRGEEVVADLANTHEEFQPGTQRRRR